MTADELDPAAILDALGVPRPTKIAPAVGGSDTAVWRVECGDATYALRVFPAEQAAACRREVLAMRVAAAGGVPVPAVHARNSWRDHPVLLLSWCSGRTVLDELQAHPARAWALGVGFGRMQARIHTVTVPMDLRRQLGSWATWTGPAEEALQACLDHLDVRSDVLLHLDYHPLNVLTDGGRITAVLDWANVRSGDPRADLARTATILRVQPGPPTENPLLMTMFRRLFTRAWRRGYEQEAGAIGDLAPFYAWAGMAMVRDLSPKVGRPHSWLEPRDIDRVRRWAAVWARRAAT